MLVAMAGTMAVAVVISSLFNRKVAHRHSSGRLVVYKYEGLLHLSAFYSAAGRLTDSKYLLSCQ
jgi:hypothetical protein